MDGLSWARPRDAKAIVPQAAPNKALRRCIFWLFQKFVCVMNHLRLEKLQISSSNTIDRNVKYNGIELAKVKQPVDRSGLALWWQLGKFQATILKFPPFPAGVCQPTLPKELP